MLSQDEKKALYKEAFALVYEVQRLLKAARVKHEAAK